MGTIEKFRVAMDEIRAALNEISETIEHLESALSSPRVTTSATPATPIAGVRTHATPDPSAGHGAVPKTPTEIDESHLNDWEGDLFR